jgi:hypothetical protein
LPLAWVEPREHNVMRAARYRNRVAAAAAVSAALVIVGCGSTAPNPSAPSPVQAAPLPQYASLVGQWGGKVSIALMYRNPDSPSSSHCDASASVREHTTGTLSGSVGFNGSSMDSDKQCGRGFAFTADVAPNGIITGLRSNSSSLGSEECSAVSDPIFRSGSASSTGFGIVLLDSARCRWPPFDARYPPVRETDRTFTVVIDRRRSTLLPQ